MRILDLWCGSKSATQAFEDAGHEVISVDVLSIWKPTICKDIIDVTVEELADYGEFDFIWASPDCTVYSIANLHSGHYKLPDPNPQTQLARYMERRMKHTLHLIEGLKPRIGFLIENPRGLLRKLPLLRHLARRTLTYCSYGDIRMKPTDVWGMLPGWAPRPPCHNENPLCDHERSPRGSVSGTQGLDWEDKIRIPLELSSEILQACEDYDDRSLWGTLEKWYDAD